MRPLTVVTGILLGSCLSIAVSLSAVLVVYALLADDYPRLQHEFRPLLTSLLIFFVMTAIAASSFYALLKNHPAWPLGQLGLWLGLAASSWYYWP
ncbi:MAG: hypothetical protein KJO82_04400 [Gammaproteobacteria bacterium]|nr:hypothetical protein [Gammaproteobacteria bacterium]